MKAKVGKSANILLRLLIMGLSFWFVYDQLIHHRNLDEVMHQFRTLLINSVHQNLMWLLLILLPVNLALEAFKWKVLIDKLEPVSFNRAFTAVLSGISVSMMMPNRVGDYLGRVFILQKESHIKGILVTLIGSLSQLLTTVIAGCIALTFSFSMFFEFEFSNYKNFSFGLLALVFSLLIFALILYFNVGLLKVVTAGIFPRRKQKLLRYIDVFSLYTRSELLKVLLLSVSRFIVFSMQYYLLLLITGFDIGYFEAMMLISLTYLFMAVIPTIAITELGVRGSVAIYIFGLYFANTTFWNESGATAVFTASSVLWLLNLVVPSLFGIIFVYRLRFFRKEDLDG
ncbi:MAG: hypothetical protein HOO86_12880 [Bacteroidales bacterium]|nr:hypothetical protein [Bacteroidales bacterium]